ncbi:autotransporter domain-containing protein [Campylobacter aviculae]|uniref:Autotransporter domain-containing protein n=2 Tax=Campylobacter aviculae TaxID=2510190 RepID=A0A4U7BNY9_9BACT|nr:autotransporter domain-containing protein [Campylobacter aviculae]
MYSHKKVMLSAIAASFIVANAAYAQTIINNPMANDGLIQDSKDKSHYTYHFEDRPVYSNLGSEHFTDDANRIKHLTIQATVGSKGVFYFTPLLDSVSIGGFGYLLNYPNTGFNQINPLTSGIYKDIVHNGYAFDITANKVVIAGNGKGVIPQPGTVSNGTNSNTNAIISASYGKSTITAKDGVYAINSVIDVINGSYYNNGYQEKDFDGSLLIKGNLVLRGSEVISNVLAHGTPGLYVDGKVTAANTKFVAGIEDLNRVTDHGYYVMSASGGFENGIDSKKAFTDSSSHNAGELVWHNRLINISSDLMNSKLANNAGTIYENEFKDLIYKSNTDLDNLWDFKLVQSGKSLFVTGKLDKSLYTKNGKLDYNMLNTAIKKEIANQKDNLEKLASLDGTSGLLVDKKVQVINQITYTQRSIQMAENSIKFMTANNTNGKYNAKIKDVQAQLNKDKTLFNQLQNRLNEYRTLINNVQTQIAHLTPKLYDEYRVEEGQKGQIFVSLADSSVAGNIAGTTDYILGDGKVVRDVEKAANSNAGNSALNTPIGAINIANDMAISNRLAKFSNPYSTMMAGESFAAGNGTASDSSFAYGARSYANNVWANAIGGANIVDGNSGALYGVSIGYDRLLGENTILGAYLTYANSDIKTDLVKQESDNLQVGLYSRTLHGNHEFDFKGYAQFGWTDQDRQIVNSINSSDFTRKFLGASGTYGYVFDIGNNFYIKPLAGLNLYYSFTPDYTESGIYAQHVRSQSNFDASLEAGAEFRKYLSKQSYIYAIPKIEQYIVTSGDDYTARFVGSPVSFTVDGSDSKKTFGALILGGDINFANQWAFTFSAGVKQLLGGKVDDQDETYVSGNVGLKYQF